MVKQFSVNLIRLKICIRPTLSISNHSMKQGTISSFTSLYLTVKINGKLAALLLDNKRPDHHTFKTIVEKFPESTPSLETELSIYKLHHRGRVLIGDVTDGGQGCEPSPDKPNVKTGAPHLAHISVFGFFQFSLDCCFFAFFRVFSCDFVY